MRRRYPVTIRTFGQEDLSDFGLATDVSVDAVTIGAQVRELSLEERDSLSLSINQDAHILSVPYTPTTAAVRPGTYRVVFDELEYQVLSINRGNFGKRTMEIVIGRNA